MMQILSQMMHKKKGPRPPNATSIYKVTWHVMAHNSYFSLGLASTSPQPALEKSKTFASKEKAEQLVKDLQAAFAVLDYTFDGHVFIEEDWLE